MDRYNLGTFPFFMVCFVSLLPVIVVALAAGISAVKWAGLNSPRHAHTAPQQDLCFHVMFCIFLWGCVFFFEVQVFRLAAALQPHKAADYTGRTARVKSLTSSAAGGFQPAQAHTLGSSSFLWQRSSC